MAFEQLFSTLFFLTDATFPLGSPFKMHQLFYF
jgi:hypothetical protein